MKRAAIIACLVWFWLWGCVAWSQDNPKPKFRRATVTEVTDGDTVKVKYRDGTTARVRLAGIDAPERNQPGGKEATAYLEKLLEKTKVRVYSSGKDRYNRTVATLKVNNLIINRTMVLNGHAWWYHRYSKDSKLARNQIQAMLAKRGIWAADKPIAPWLWRKRSRNE
jgi:micrococcal nuclease